MQRKPMELNIIFNYFSIDLSFSDKSALINLYILSINKISIINLCSKQAIKIVMIKALILS